jgi:hypothetical protein
MEGILSIYINQLKNTLTIAFEVIIVRINGLIR